MNGYQAPALGDVFWRGIRFHVSPAHAEILFTLARRGEAATYALEMSTATYGCLRVQLWKLRKKIAAAGLPLKIENVPGFGYRLREI